MGLPTKAMHAITEATTVACLMHAAPTWWDCTTAEDLAKLGVTIMQYSADGVTEVLRRGQSRQTRDSSGQLGTMSSHFPTDPMS